jgi:putative ABC transport system permease protein
MPTNLSELLRVGSAVAALLACLLGFAAGQAGERSETSPPEILVSRQLAEAFDLQTGQVVSFAPQRDGERAREFRIAGTFEPIGDPARLSDPRHEARFHLSDLVDLTGEPNSRRRIDAINVALHDPASLGDFQRELATRAPGLYATSTVAGPEQTPFRALERFHQAIAIVTVLGSTAFLVALMLMRAEERRETVGILRLIGLTRRRILLEVLIEGLFVALAGAVFGIVFASLLQGGVNLFFQSHYDTALVFMRVTPDIARFCLLVAVPLGVFAGWLASWTLLRREITALLRR